jgi:proteasome lid subunit RPN8/RPN11
MRVWQTVLDAITAHARRDSPRECCGLLIGTTTDVTEAVQTTNVADDPLRRYEISPLEHLAQIRRCRQMANERGIAIGIVGAYHSHPHSAASPSPTDLEQAFEEFVYVIAGPVSGAAPVEIRAYRLTNGRFEAAELIVVEPPATASRHATER